MNKKKSLHNCIKPYLLFIIIVASIHLGYSQTNDYYKTRPPHSLRKCTTKEIEELFGKDIGSYVAKPIAYLFLNDTIRCYEKMTTHAIYGKRYIAKLILADTGVENGHKFFRLESSPDVSSLWNYYLSDMRVYKIIIENNTLLYICSDDTAERWLNGEDGKKRGKKDERGEK